MRKILNINKNWAFLLKTSQVPDSLEGARFVDLPHTWNAIDGQDGGNDYFRGPCCYMKSIAAEELPQADCYFLEIRGANSSADVYLDGEQVVLTLNGENVAICRADEIAIKGKHNLENAMGAIAFAYLSGVSPADIREVLMEFQGVEHRLEPVRTLNDVLYINDSKGTNPDSTIKAIEAYDRPLVIILGGKNKGVPFAELAQLVKQRVKKAVLVGQAKTELKEALTEVDYHEFVEVDSFEAAVATAANLAEPGDIVLLSPACTSWDMFSSFEERGRLFKQLVNKL